MTKFEKIKLRKIMNCIILLAKNQNPRVEFLTPILQKEYEVIKCSTIEEVPSLIDQNIINLTALVVDHPKGVDNIDHLFDLVKKQNITLLAVPIVILSDEENEKDDEEYLNDVAISIVTPNDSEKVVLYRISRSFDAVNSVSFQEFSKMLTALPSLIYIKDTKGRYVFCSQSWHHVYNHNDGVSKSIRGMTDFEIRKDKKNAQLAHESDMKVISSGVGANYLIKEDSDGVVDYLRVIKEPIKDKEGNVRGIIALINNVTEQEMMRQKLRQQSITDTLTGLHNRLYFQETITKLKKDSNSYPITLISADCDGLKAINDKYGHLAGDVYIRMAAELLRTTLPERAIICRMGGDEYVSIIPNCNKRTAQSFIRQLAKNAKSYKTEHFALKISFGTHTNLEEKESIDSCILASDKAMYRNKNKKKTINNGR